MSERMTAEELAAIRLRTEAATPGPWKRDERYVVGGADIPGSRPGGEVILQANPTRLPWDGYDLSQRMGNADFAAHARTDLPRALDEIKSLGEREERLEQALQRIERFCSGLSIHADPLGWSDKVQRMAHDALGGDGDA